MMYEGAVFRPPSEARSLIIQVTIGCAHNKCTFCGMYKAKKFRMRTLEEIFADLDEMSYHYGKYPIRIFLADGDALVLRNELLVKILERIKLDFPKVERITAYARASDVCRKSVAELIELKEHGLEMVYMGAESGNETILKNVCKGIGCKELIEASDMLKQSGIKLSVTFISGLGGKEMLEEHALDSAKLTNRMNPEYVGFLTLMLEDDVPIMQDIRAGRLTLLKPAEVVEEMQIYLTNVDSEGSVFRSTHASNYFMLKGTLNGDRDKMLAILDEVNKRKAYRPDFIRGL